MCVRVDKHVFNYAQSVKSGGWFIKGICSYPPACFCESTLNARVAFSGVFLRIVAGCYLIPFLSEKSAMRYLFLELVLHQGRSDNGLKRVGAGWLCHQK